MSTLKERITDDLKAAMLARDEFAKVTLGSLKAAILNEEVAKGLRDSGLGDDQVEQLIAREVKKRDESAALFEQGGNQASADKERAEKELLSRYLPEQVSEDELAQAIDTIIGELKPDGPKDMGKVIGAVKAKFGTSADGATVARLVKAKLVEG